jgi:hypothetical protein
VTSNHMLEEFSEVISRRRIARKYPNGIGFDPSYQASMSSRDTKNPTGGVTMRHVMESPDPIHCSCQKRPDYLCEPPLADPHEGWCGGWGRKTPGYPIRPSEI